MRLFFASPKKGAQPVTYLCCAPEMSRRSGVYLHAMREKEPSGLARDKNIGARLWQAGEALLAKHAPSAGATPPSRSA